MTKKEIINELKDVNDDDEIILFTRGEEESDKEYFKIEDDEFGNGQNMTFIEIYSIGRVM